MFSGDVVAGTEECEAVLNEPASAPACRLRDLVSRADLLMGNLELPLTERGYPAEKPITWRAHPRLAQALRALGFGALGLANNHMLDFGTDGLLDTLAALRSTGLPAIGAGETVAEAARPYRAQTTAGGTVAVLAVSCALPPGSTATNRRPGVSPIRVRTTYSISPRIFDSPGAPPVVRTEAERPDVEQVTEAIRRLKAHGCAVVIYIHWGIGFTTALAEYQRPLARELVAAGADAVLGHHPHVLQGFEVLGRAPVLYSLSNFISHASIVEPAFGAAAAVIGERWSIPADSVVAVLSFQASRLVAVHLIPVQLNALGFPEELPCVRAEAVLAAMQMLPPSVGPQLEVDHGVGSLRL
ncbi:MAG: CapA family protein [Anaerolineales bacterium]|nr:CapA family protein [Anaerolineales bacterium]